MYPKHTLEYILQHLRYVPETGLHWWLIARQGRQLNRPAGSLWPTRSGRIYRAITIDCHRYYAQVLAWWMMTSEWPERQVDHINTDSTDNRWVNLRLATQSENNINRPPKRPGLTGASFHKPSGRWQAYIKKDGKQIPLGYFKTAEEAHEAYKKAALELFGDFAHVSLKDQD